MDYSWVIIDSAFGWQFAFGVFQGEKKAGCGIGFWAEATQWSWFFFPLKKKKEYTKEIDVSSFLTIFTFALLLSILDIISNIVLNNFDTFILLNSCNTGYKILNLKEKMLKSSARG